MCVREIQRWNEVMLGGGNRDAVNAFVAICITNDDIIWYTQFIL